LEGLGRAPGRLNRRCPLAAAAHVAPAAWPRDQHHPSLGGLMPAVSQGGDPDISRKFDRSLSTLCGGQPHLGCVVGDASLDGYVTTPVPPGRSQRSRPTWYRKLKLSPRMTTVDAIGLSAKPPHGVPVMGCRSWGARHGVPVMECPLWSDRHFQHAIPLVPEQVIRRLDITQLEPMCHHRPQVNAIRRDDRHRPDGFARLTVRPAAP